MKQWRPQAQRSKLYYNIHQRYRRYSLKLPITFIDRGAPAARAPTHKQLLTTDPNHIIYYSVVYYTGWLLKPYIYFFKALSLFFVNFNIPFQLKTFSLIYIVATQQVHRTYYILILFILYLRQNIIIYRTCVYTKKGIDTVDIFKPWVNCDLYTLIRLEGSYRIDSIRYVVNLVLIAIKYKPWCIQRGRGIILNRIKSFFKNCKIMLCFA